MEHARRSGLLVLTCVAVAAAMAGAAAAAGPGDEGPASPVTLRSSVQPGDEGSASPVTLRSSVQPGDEGSAGASRPASSARQRETARVAATLAAARAAADGLGNEIRELLMQELKQGGPQAAVVACARSAQARTNEYRARTGVDIRRVSLRHRNEVNQPDAFERAALEGFDRLPVEARPRAEHWQLVTADGRPWLRYVRPLVTNAMCLNCHGPADSLSAAVKAALAKEYPGDRATGFAAGDVRGAISVKLPLPADARP